MRKVAITHKYRNTNTNNMRCYKFGSLTRTSDLQVNPFTVHPMKRDQWATGDYVVGKYCGVSTDDEWVENTFGKEK